jgi:hypothetical protein
MTPFSQSSVHTLGRIRPWVTGWDYALRYWQECAFRDLKSEGWPWQCSPIGTPAYANRLLLVLASAYAWVLTLGTLVYTDPALQQPVTKGQRPTYSLFRLGLRLWESLRGQVSALLAHLTPDDLCFLPTFPSPLKVSQHELPGREGSGVR